MRTYSNTMLNGKSKTEHYMIPYSMILINLEIMVM